LATEVAANGAGAKDENVHITPLRLAHKGKLSVDKIISNAFGYVKIMKAGLFGRPLFF
jgi:hypothetical protein